MLSWTVRTTASCGGSEGDSMCNGLEAHSVGMQGEWCGNDSSHQAVFGLLGSHSNALSHKIASGMVDKVTITFLSQMNNCVLLVGSWWCVEPARKGLAH